LVFDLHTELFDLSDESLAGFLSLFIRIGQLRMQIEDQEKAKSDILKVKKNLELEVGNLNEDLSNADKTIAALNANIGKHQKTVQEMTMALDEAHRALDDHKTALLRSDKRCRELKHIKEELEGNLDGADRARRGAESEKSEMAAHIADLERQVSNITSQKRKAEVDVAGLRESLEEFESAALSAEDKVKRHADLVAKLQGDLSREADGRSGLERQNQKLSNDIFQLNARLEEVEVSARSAAKNKISQLEIKIRQLENECANEGKARNDAQHALKNLDRVIREKEFNSDEDMKTIQRLQGQIEFQNNKAKALRRTIDDGEAQVAVMQNKLRKAIHDVEEAEERAAMLETQLVRGGRGGGSSSSSTTRVTTRRVITNVKSETE
jgi:myosin protein heavy chain